MLQHTHTPYVHTHTYTYIQIHNIQIHNIRTHTYTYTLWLVWAAPLSVHVLTFRHPKLFKDVFFPSVLIVIQPLLCAVLLHSLCCNIHINMHSYGSCERHRFLCRCWHSDIRDYLRVFSIPLDWLSFSLSFVLFFYILYAVTHAHRECKPDFRQTRTDSDRPKINSIHLLPPLAGTRLCQVSYFMMYYAIYTHTQIQPQHYSLAQMLSGGSVVFQDSFIVNLMRDGHGGQCLCPQHAVCMIRRVPYLLAP